MALFGRKKSPPDIDDLSQRRDVPRLVEALGNEKADIRDRARDALREIDDPAVVDSLKAIVADHSAPAILRDAAYDALGRVGLSSEDYASELKRRPAPRVPAAVASDADASSWYCSNCQKWVTRGQAAYDLSGVTDWEIGFPVNCPTCHSRIASRS